MLRLIFTQNKVFYPIVGLISIKMVDNLFSIKNSSKMFLHYVSVHVNASIFITKRMSWLAYLNIFCPFLTSIFFPKFFHWLRGGQSGTLRGAINLFVKLRIPLSCPTGEISSAIRTFFFFNFPTNRRIILFPSFVLSNSAFFCLCKKFFHSYPMLIKYYQHKYKA